MFARRDSTRLLHYLSRPGTQHAEGDLTEEGGLNGAASGGHYQHAHCSAHYDEEVPQITLPLLSDVCATLLATYNARLEVCV